MPAMAKPASRTAKPASSAAPKQPKAKPSSADGPSHPPYFEMIKEAITALKERTGSSAHAIGKYMEEKHGKSLPANYKKMLSIQLRGFASKGKLVKVKASYKLSDAAKKDSPKPKTKVAATKPAKDAAAKPKKADAAAKPKKAPAAGAGTKRKAPEKKVVAAKLKKSPAAKAKAKLKKSPAAKAKAKPKTVKSPVAKKARKAAAA